MWENNGLKLQNQLEFLAFIQVVDVTINMTQDLILPLVNSQSYCPDAVHPKICICSKHGSFEKHFFWIDCFYSLLFCAFYAN